jgi:uncharacterized membrane protein
MENKKVGFLIIGIAIVMAFVILLFNSAMQDFVNISCGETHGLSCPMYDTITQQTYLALAVVAIIISIGGFLFFAKPEKKIIIQKSPKKKIDVEKIKKFNGEEKKVLKLVKENKAIFQADLIEQTNFGKAKMTRILDRLEGHGIVERKRRGMTNIVILNE